MRKEQSYLIGLRLSAKLNGAARELMSEAIKGDTRSFPSLVVSDEAGGTLCYFPACNGSA